MTISSFPFDGQTTTETQYRKLFREFQDSGIVDSPFGSTALKVTANGSGMTVAVAAGMAIIQGHAIISTAIENLAIDAASTSTRVDTVVLHLDPALDSITLKVLKGNPLSGGVPLALTQTDTGIYEMPLAYVTITPTTTNIASGAVSDIRAYVGGRVGVWSTSTRPATPRETRLGYNKTTSKWEWYNGTAWVDLVQSVDWSNLTGKPSTFSAAWADITGKPSTFTPATHTHLWADLTDKPTSFTPSAHVHAWADITGKPTSFTPATHTHTGYAPAGGQFGVGYISAYSVNAMSLRWEGRLIVRVDNSDFVLSTDTHTHPNYANDIAWLSANKVGGGDTIARANGTDRVHAAEPEVGPWYAAWVDGNHNFCRNTSSIRYKENVRAHSVDPAKVLALQPSMYDRKSGAATDEYGLIAEEVAELVPELVVHYEGEIDSVRYDLLAVALLDVVKSQQSTLDALSARLDALEASK